MEWAKKHPRIHAVGGVLMLVGGVLSTISGAWALFSGEPLVPVLARVTLPSFSARVGLLIATIAVAIVGGIFLRQVFKATRRQSIPSNAEIHTQGNQTTTPDRREALESAKVAWGLWHTGHRNRIDRLLGLESLTHILILNPESKSLGIVAERSHETVSSLVTQIRDTTREALENKKEVRWYPEHRESAITIYDNTPITENGILKPCSSNAWMYVQYLTPDTGVDQRSGGPIYNKGKTKPQFMGFYREYEDIWENKSIPAKLQHDNPATERVSIEPLSANIISLNAFIGRADIEMEFSVISATIPMRLERLQLLVGGKPAECHTLPATITCSPKIYKIVFSVEGLPLTWLSNKLPQGMEYGKLRLLADNQECWSPEFPIPLKRVQST